MKRLNITFTDRHTEMLEEERTRSEKSTALTIRELIDLLFYCKTKSRNKRFSVADLRAIVDAHFKEKRL